MNETKVRELIAKFRGILKKPISNWYVEGKSIFHSPSTSTFEPGDGPLIRDHAVHPQTLALIADALNFTVRRLALQQLADELEAALAAEPERSEHKLAVMWRKDLNARSKDVPKSDYERGRDAQFKVCIEALDVVANERWQARVTAEIIHKANREALRNTLNRHHADPDEYHKDWCVEMASEIRLALAPPSPDERK